MKEKVLGFLSLFSSFGTLICCALPAFLVTMGLGAVVASAVSALPGLVTLSRNKEWVFLGAGLLIALNFLLVYRPRRQTVCDAVDGSGCEIAGRWSRVVLWASAILYLAGFSVAYLALPFYRFLERL